MQRRQFIGVVSGGVATIGLAGCLGLGGGGGNGNGDGSIVETDSPGAAVESWIRLLYEDPEKRAERVEEVWHNDSPVFDMQGEGGQLTGDLEIIETTVINEGLTESELQERLGVWAEEVTVSQLADNEEAAVVEITTRVTVETGQTSEGSERYLVVTENRKWQVMLGPL